MARDIFVDSFEDVQECLGEMYMDINNLLETDYNLTDLVHDTARNSRETLVSMKAVVRRVDKHINLHRKRMSALEKKVAALEARLDDFHGT